MISIISHFVFGIAFAIVVGLPISILFILWACAIKKCSCVVTNKRIYGVTNIFILMKRYSYRLDEIDNVEIVSGFGAHTLALNFTQGHSLQGNVVYNRGVSTITGAGIFRISNIKNIDEVYSKLTNLLTSVKNDKDLMVDIEMSKVDVENRKAAAFENMVLNMNQTEQSKNTSSQNYIKELKGLKELLDSGVITEEEFNKKKKDLLNK